MDAELDQLSPSKTRQRTAQAHQLNTLTLWLTSLLSSSPPQSQSQLTDPNSSPDGLPPHLSNWRTETTSHPDGPAILAALQTLRASNLRANEIQNLAFEAVREEIGILRQQHNDRKQGFAPARELLEMIRAALNPDARERLTRLARAGVLLDVQPNTSFELGEDGHSQRGLERGSEEEIGPENETLETRFTRAVIAQSSQLIELHRQIALLDCLRAQINQQTQTQTRTQPRQNAIPHGEQAGLSSSAASTNPHPHTQTHTSSPNNSTTISISISNDDEIHQATTHLNHATKPLALKTNEYRARIHALQRQLHHLRPSSTPASKTASRHAPPEINSNANSNAKLNEPVEIDNAIDNLTQLHRNTEDRKIKVRVLENQIQALGGLPPDLEVARAEVRRAQRELEMWRGRREEVFGLVGGG